MKIAVPLRCLLFAAFALSTHTVAGQSPRTIDNLSENGTVYFYRVKEVAGLDNRAKKVFVNGKILFKMKQMRQVAFSFPPGKYEVVIKKNEAETLLTVEAGKSYFVRVSEVVAGFFKNQNVSLMPSDQATFQMRNLEQLSDKDISDRSFTRVNK